MHQPARPVHVAIDATSLLGQVTGIGQFTAGLLGGLANQDQVQVDAFAISWRRRGEIVKHLPSGISALSRPMPARPLHAAWKVMNWPNLEMFIGIHDVVHGTNYIVPPTSRATRIMSVHDLTTVHYPHLCDAKTLRYPDLIRRAVARGAWIHTDSNFIKQEVCEEFSIDPSKVVTIYPGIPGESKNDGAGGPGNLPEGLSRELMSRRIESYVVFVGTIEPRKDLPTLLKAFSLLHVDHPGLGLVIVGRMGWGQADFETTLASLDPAIQSKVVVTGYVAQHERESIISGACCFAYPSLYEGFGFPPLEAMRLGVPVVSTTQGSIPEVVGDAAILVDPRNPESLAKAIDGFISNDQLNREYVDRGFIQVARFSWERCAVGFVDLYIQCAGLGA